MTAFRSKTPHTRHLVMSFALALLCVIDVPAVAGDLTYLVHSPPTASPHPPLIVLLHGAGADERDMIGLWRDLPKDFVVVSPRAPFPDGGGFRWYRKAGVAPRPGDLTLSRKVVDRVVDNAVTRFHIDPKRIFIAGFSQGAVMVYEVALHEPDRFRGAAVLSGSLFASATDRGPAHGAWTHTSFFVGHGNADRRIPFVAARHAHTELVARGIPVTFHGYAGMGHAVGAQETRDLSAWLAEHETSGADAASR